jgi:large subunit ribosomal protein L7Ae
MANFNDNLGLNKSYGGGLMGIKNQHMMKKRQAILDLEAARKANI